MLQQNAPNPFNASTVISFQVPVALAGEEGRLTIYNLAGQRVHPIESTFATVRHRTRQTKACGSHVTTLTMVFKLATQAERHWRRLNHYQLITHLVDGYTFTDGELQLKKAAWKSATVARIRSLPRCADDGPRRFPSCWSTWISWPATVGRGCPMTIRIPRATSRPSNTRRRTRGRFCCPEDAQT